MFYFDKAFNKLNMAFKEDNKQIITLSERMKEYVPIIEFDEKMIMKTDV